MQLVAITDEVGVVVEAGRLAQAERVHRQLRPQLPAEYPEKMRRVFADGGRMIVAVDITDILGLALYRIYEDTFNDRKCYVDDLVTDERSRSRGIGHALLGWLVQAARGAGCKALCLDSGTQRTQAHKFYFREGFVIPSFHFSQQLT